MNVQVLVATMDQKDDSLLDKMGIHTDVIVGNQCDRNEIREFTRGGHRVKWLSFAERGVGLNRNNALMRADGDVVLFADDDMEYVDGYGKLVEEAYEKIPQADVIIFDLQYPDTPRKPITKIEKMNAKKAMRFGAARISARLSSLRIHGIAFNLCFGGGARFGSGEDSLFLMDCIRRGLKVYTYPAVIARLSPRESTWFRGYNDQFFFDKGVLFSVLFPRMCGPYALAHCMKKRKRYNSYGWFAAYRQMRKGIQFRKRDL